MKKKHRKLVFAVLSIVLGMSCLTAAAPPLYSIFCKATGYGGAVDYGVNSGFIGENYYIINFNSDLERGLDFDFTSEQTEIVARTGENQLIFYKLKNKKDKDVNAIAIYNVTPHVAGQYFKKVDCFCFEEQTFKAHEERLLPVVFFIDPKIEKDKSIKYVKEITLSYTFFKLDD